MFGSVLLTEFLVQANKTETIKQQNQTEKKTLVALLHVVSFSYGKNPLIFTKYAKTKVSLWESYTQHVFNNVTLLLKLECTHSSVDALHTYAIYLCYFLANLVWNFVSSKSLRLGRVLRKFGVPKPLN